LECQAGKAWYKGNVLIVIEEDEDKRALLKLYHDSLAIGHSGMAKMLQVLRREYWWPSQWKFVQEYVRGCMQC
jgi:hypothetical protein